jgi:hypothetical protein
MALAAGCSTHADDLPVPPPPSSVVSPPGADDFALGAFASPLTIADAEAILLRTRTFAYGGMAPKRQVQAFNVLLDQPDASARFLSIATGGGTAGKLYAVAAFLVLNMDVPAPLAAELAAERSPLLVVSSDVAWRKTPSEVLGLIASERLWELMRRDKDETMKYFKTFPP